MSQTEISGRNRSTESLGRSSLCTVLLVPHRSPRFREFRLTRWHALAGLVAIAMLVAGAAFAPRLFLQVGAQSRDLERLRTQNRELKRERDEFDRALGEVQEQLELVEARTRLLAGELGLDDLPSARPAAGGGTGTPVAANDFWFDGEVRSLRSRTQRLDASLELLDRAFDDRRSLLAATPDRLPVDGWFSHGFGWRKDPFTGKREFHRGLDIVAAGGTEVHAPADGEVVRAMRWGNYGKVVDVDHGHGFVTRYAHLSRIEVAEGDAIRRGDLLGLVGSTGRSTGPHLHYEVFQDGRRVNPWGYIGRD